MEKEHNLIFDLRSLRTGIGTKKLTQKVYVIYDDFAYECIVVPQNLNFESNSEDFGGMRYNSCGDMSCSFYVEYYRMIDLKEVPYDGVIVDQKVIEKVIEKEKIVKEYYNIYQFIS